MNRFVKTTIYGGLILCVAALAYGFAVEHTQVTQSAAGASNSRMMACFGGFLAALIALGLVCAYDVAHHFGWRFERWFLQGGRPVEPGPELEEAQRVRARGEPLDAIRILRQYLENNPGELHVMSRIAEIYKDDLENYLAAALEYEELLKHKLPDEEWGWAALHLAKLYGRLNRPEESMALLERIDTEYGQTVAARRARRAREQIGATTQDDAEAESQGEGPAG
jgi:tetratricopeptide (TPR) repeat protein